MSARYAFAEVAAALREHWGLTLRRGGSPAFAGRDGRWSTDHARTGYIVTGNLPSVRAYGSERWRSLRQVVSRYELAAVIDTDRERGAQIVTTR